jgi:IS5 family transposase
VVLIDATECPIERPKRGKKGRRKNRQKHFYSGKKKRHTIKAQMIVNKKDGTIISTDFSNGKMHDKKLLDKSETAINPNTKVFGDSGYQGAQKKHSNIELPRKKPRKGKLSQAEKLTNKEISKQRVPVEHKFAAIKKFRILKGTYRNRRARFGLRFNLICAIHNLEITQ